MLILALQIFQVLPLKNYFCNTKMSLGPNLVSLGHRPPRGTPERVTIKNPSSLGSVDKVVLSNGRVTRVMKIFEIHGFAFETGIISLHVRYIWNDNFCSGRCFAIISMFAAVFGYLWFW